MTLDLASLDSIREFAQQFGKRGKVLFAGAPRFNEFVLQTTEDPKELNGRLAQQNIIGGFPLGKFYPELGNAAVWCCTEMTKRETIDQVARTI